MKAIHHLLMAMLALPAAATFPSIGLTADEEAASKACLYERSAKNDGQALCIGRESYDRDLCRVMEHVARANAVPPQFFARLIWRESLFRAEAVSPKGAEGIAQFMPGTAKLRGLANSFDVIEALAASSLYLSELRDRFGNLGLAAAAYNAGEAGLQTFLKADRLPIETRDYVFAITGHTVETWRDKPPETAAPPLDADKSFMEGCVELAETRRLQEPVLIGSADWAPWGVQLSAHYDPTVASRLFVSAIGKLPEPLGSERALIVRQKGGNFGYRPRYAARIGRATRAEATELCTRIKAAGVPCTTFRN
ncbi:transglycosylase SLT domain-containing protein [Rhizobium petrolearium]|uniref:Transglycosylase SLT domain-containing protein n=2 Tax=Neorhizobium petrolearium TaxID=515361 RepID=A0ABY8LWL2_9HYPH|nr:transglycosylase SLT domain-containing protein [Neorhizobium petrolearium]MCC2611499.1 transglycosylase SLT domain-containing protein [Neorhizobium petrolearium]WGI66689.1 transglycosylase SLT domain-containing protein [Neorhizobium petrolearium]